MDRRLAIALVVVLGGVAAFFFHRSSQNGDGFESSDSAHTGLEVREDGDDFVVTDVEGQRASVRFPDRPNLEIMPAAGMVKPISVAETSGRSREMYFGVMRFDAAATRAIELDHFYDLERDGALKNSGATLDRESAITVDGFAGREVYAHAPSEVMHLRFVFDRERGLSYMALGGAIGGDADDVDAAQRFVETLRIPH